MFALKSKRLKKYREIRPTELAEMLQEPAAPILVDVRSPEEFSQGHIAGSRLLPLPVLPVRQHELPRDREIVLVCRSGARSGMACEMLSARGYTKLSNLVEGVMGWSRRGYRLTP